MRRFIKRVFVVLFTAFALVYLGVVALMFFSQRSMLFPAPPPSLPSAEQGELLTLDGPTFATWRRAAPGRRTVVFFHGNGNQLSDAHGWSARLADDGLGFLAVEYPGYGPASAQKPSEAGLYRAAETALQHLASQGVARADTVLFGQSIGTGVAIEMARRGFGSRIALVSPYTSIPDVGAELLSFLPVRLLARDVFPSLQRAPELSLPALVVHGDQDALIPYEHGQKISAALKGGLLTVPGAGHNDLLQQSVREELVAFFAAPDPH